MKNPTSPGPGRDVLALTLAGAVLLTGGLLETGSEQVAAGSTTLPRTCLLHTAGLGNCPGCGLTRSVVACCHLRWRESWALHPGGVLIVGLALLNVPFRLARLCRRELRGSFHWLSPLTRGIFIVVLAIGLGRWVAEWTVHASGS